MARAYHWRIKIGDSTCMTFVLRRRHPLWLLVTKPWAAAAISSLDTIPGLITSVPGSPAVSPKEVANPPRVPVSANSEALSGCTSRPPFSANRNFRRPIIRSDRKKCVNDVSDYPWAVILADHKAPLIRIYLPWSIFTDDKQRFAEKRRPPVTCQCADSSYLQLY